MSTDKLLPTNRIQLPDIFEQLPILTTRNAGWSKINLEVYRLSPGETPKFALDHPIVSINIRPPAKVSGDR